MPKAVMFEVDVDGEEPTWEYDVDYDIQLPILRGDAARPSPDLLATASLDKLRARVNHIMQAAVKAIDAEIITSIRSPDAEPPTTQNGRLEKIGQQPQLQTRRATNDSLHRSQSGGSALTFATAASFRHGTPRDGGSSGSLAYFTSAAAPSPRNGGGNSPEASLALPQGSSGSGMLVHHQRDAAAEGFALQSTPLTDGKRIFYKLLPELMQMHAEDEATADDAGSTAQISYYTASNDPRNFSSEESHVTEGPWLMLNPSGIFRMVWDVIAGIALAYDVYVIPLAVFDIPQYGFTLYISLSWMMYWACDIIVTFLTAYHWPDGTLERRLSYVAYRYCKSWLLPDVMIVGVDCIELLPKLLEPGTGSAGSAAGLVRLAKVSRFIRLMRLFRLHRLAQVPRMFHMLIGMERTSIILSISRNLLIISLITHLFATVWYWIGLQGEDLGVGWLQVRKSDFWFKNYVMSLQWSIANFTPGSSGLQPETTGEFAFHIFVLFFALVVFSVFVSSTTSLIAKLMGLQSSQTQKFARLKQFLGQHRLPVHFRERVERYVEHVLMSHQDQVKQEDVELLRILSMPLRQELQLYLHVTTLEAHAFMHMLSHSNPALMRQVSTEAVSQVNFSWGDVIFTMGESLDKMGFAVSGRLRYSRKHNRRASRDRRRTVDFGLAVDELLGPLSCFCEPALWTKWRCHGTMHANEDCDLLEVNGAVFRKIAMSHHITANFVRQYGAAFLQDLNSLPVERLDLENDGEAVRELLGTYSAVRKTFRSQVSSAFSIASRPQVVSPSSTQTRLTSNQSGRSVI